MRFIAVLLMLVLFQFKSVQAHEILLRPACKQGTCFHSLLREFNVPGQIVKGGIVRRYQSGLVERQCKPNEAMDDADCRLKRPMREEFKTFVPSIAICSTSTPAIISTSNSREGKLELSVMLLNPAGDIPAYQASWTSEYLTVCHNWEPVQFDSEVTKALITIGYKPISVMTEYKAFATEGQAMAFINNAGSSSIEPSVKALEGKWFSGNPAVCKGEVGLTEELLTFKGSKFVGYENECVIRNAKVAGRALVLSMTCAGEGETSRTVEQIEFLNEQQIKRSTSDGRRRYTFVHNRCP